MDNKNLDIGKAIAQSMSSDGITFEKMNSLTEEQRTDLVLAYFESQIKKTEKIQTMYLTNEMFKNKFRESILSLCKI